MPGAFFEGLMQMPPALIAALRLIDQHAERTMLLVFYTILVVSMAVLVLGRELLSVSPIWGAGNGAVDAGVSRLDWPLPRLKTAPISASTSSINF